MGSLAKFFPHIKRMEGGYVDHPLDRGGPTNCGITLAVLGEYLGRPATAQDVKNLVEGDIISIYEKKYWNPMMLDLVKDEDHQLILIDQGINRGPVTVIRQAQQVINNMNMPGVKLALDGAMGPLTAGALSKIFGDDFDREFIQAAQHSYVDIVKRRPDQLVFLSGWMNRTHTLQDMVWNGKPSTSPVIVPKPDETPVIEPNLTPLAWAIKELGQSEIAGAKNNPRIVWYHSFTSGKFPDDETPWCASFVSAAHDCTGYRGINNAWARSWVNAGVKGTGKRGDIVVFTGHVGFVYEDYVPGSGVVKVLGGNQSNSVTIANFQVASDTVFRTPVKVA